MPDSRVLCGMRPIVVVLGVILLLAGAVWALQGAGYLLGSFMSYDPTWLWIGIVTALAGVGIVAFGVRTGRVAKSSRERRYATSSVIESYPAAPFGNGGAGVAACGIPVPSIARASILWDPLAGDPRESVHRTHVRFDSRRSESAAGRHAPPSIRTSTAQILRSPANATPPLVTTPCTTVLSAAIAMIA